MITATALGICALGTGACVTSTAYKNKVEAAYPPIGQSVPVGGETVHVIQEGEVGPPVLMIHGASANACLLYTSPSPRD